LGLSGRVDEAIQQFQLVLRQDQSACSAHLNLALAYERKDALSEDALEEFRKAVSCNPDSAQIQYQFGEALKRRGNLKAASAAYQACIRLDPGFTAAYYGLGTVLSKQGSSAEAVVAFSRFHRLQEKSAQSSEADALVAEGVALLKHGDTKAALSK